MGRRKAKQQAEGCVTLVIAGGGLALLGVVVMLAKIVFDSLVESGAMAIILWSALGLTILAGLLYALVKWRSWGSDKPSRDVEWTRFRSEIRGIFVDNRRRECGNLRVEDKLVAVRDRSNPEDVNAILLLSKGGHELGYLPREQVDEISPVVDSGGRFLVRVMQIRHASTGSVSDVVLLCELEGEHRVSPLRTKQERKQYA